MKKTVLLQVRVPERIVKELDKLIELGVFRSRSEAIAESLRKLLLEYSKIVSEEELTIILYLLGKLKRDLGPRDIVEVDVAEARKNLRKFFGTDKVDEVLRKIRSREAL